jgi:hypothetical protein
LSKCLWQNWLQKQDFKMTSMMFVTSWYSMGFNRMIVKYYALAHIEEKGSRGYPPRARVESLPDEVRNKTLYRVVHRVNGERRPKNFSLPAEAKAHAKNIIKEIYTQGDSKIHLAADEKLDWQAAMNVLKRAGIRSSLETICRQYADLCAAAGGAGLLTDIVRRYVSSGPAKHMPIQLGRLKDIFISTMESEGRSTRYVQVLKSYCGTFVREIGPDTMTDQITREMIQEFLNDRKVGPRGKLNSEHRR